MVMIILFKTIWHITSKQTRVVLKMVVQVAEEWMVIVQHPGMVSRVHIQRRKTRPGGEWTLEGKNKFLKYTLSTETVMDRDCQILRSELVCNRLLHCSLHSNV